MLYQRSNYSIEDLQNIIDKFIKTFQKKKVLLLHGDLGSGKTQIVKNIGLHLGIKKNIFSPTFLISKSYDFNNNKKLCHYDFYRLANINELAEIGFFEVLQDKNCLVAIEWPEKIPNLRKNILKFIDKDQICDIYLSHTDDPKLRNIKIKY